MKAKSIQIGNTYHITLGRNEVLGEVIAETETGWEVRLTTSDKVVKVNNADRFLKKTRMIATTQDEAATATPEAEVVEGKAQTPKAAKTPQSENVATEQPKKHGLIKGQMSGLDAAAMVLAEDNTEMNVRQIAEAAIARKYWAPTGATPHATIASAIIREIRSKGEQSRFLKVGKGLFCATNVTND